MGGIHHNQFLLRYNYEGLQLRNRVHASPIKQGRQCQGDSRYERDQH